MMVKNSIGFYIFGAITVLLNGSVLIMNGNCFMHLVIVLVWILGVFYLLPELYQFCREYFKTGLEIKLISSYLILAIFLILAIDLICLIVLILKVF